MFVYMCGVELEGLLVHPARDLHHLHHILDPLLSERVGVHDLVGERELVIEHVEVADTCVDVHWFDRVAAREVDAVEVLGELQEPLALLAGAGGLACFHVPVVRRRGNVAEHDVIATNGDLSLRVARGDGEVFGRLADHLHDEFAVHPHDLLFDRATCLAEDLERFVVQKLDTDVLEDAHGGIVDRLERRPSVSGSVGLSVLTGMRHEHLLDGSGSPPVGCTCAPAGSSTFRFRFGHRFLLAETTMPPCGREGIGRKRHFLSQAHGVRRGSRSSRARLRWSRTLRQRGVRNSSRVATPVRTPIPGISAAFAAKKIVGTVADHNCLASSRHAQRKCVTRREELSGARFGAEGRCRSPRRN